MWRVLVKKTNCFSVIPLACFLRALLKIMMLELFVKPSALSRAIVLMEMLDSLMEVMFLKAELKCASMKLGERCVIPLSVKMKPTLYAIKRDTNIMVNMSISGLCYLLSIYFFLGTEAFRGAFFGEGSGPIFLERYDCSAEDRFLNCALPPIGVHSCDHSSDAGVKCIG